MPHSMNRLIVLLLAMALLTSTASSQDKSKKASDTQAATPQAVSTKEAPAAIGPYSQGIKAGEFVFVSGVTARDPATNKLVEGDITVQTERVLKNIEAVLAAAGTSADKVVKTTVFLKNISDFAKMNEVYATHFKTSPPARAAVGGVAIPGDALVEIEAVALR